MRIVQNGLESYFSEFHAVSAFIHTPTWDIDTFPTILIAAVSLIDAASSARDEPGKAQLAVLIELCSKMLSLIVSPLVLLAYLPAGHCIFSGSSGADMTVKVASDTKNYQDINYLIVYCLSSTYYLGTGDSQLYQVAHPFPMHFDW